MAKEYKIGERYYLPVVVSEVDEYANCPVNLGFLDGGNGDYVTIMNKPNLLLTATEIAEEVTGRRCAECSPMYEELKSRNAELEALLKEVMATRDEAIKQNNELIAENEHQKSACEEQKRLAQNWKENAYKLDKEKEELLDAKERLDTAKEAITLLQQENSSLKSKLEDAEVMCGNAVDTSRKRQQKIATMEEVIVALVEKIRRLEGDD